MTTHTKEFHKRFKHLCKKYPSLYDDIEALLNSLSKYPNQGVPLHDNIRKIRMTIKSKGKGKSGGARVYFNYHNTSNGLEIKLITIFDKGEIDNISLKNIIKASMS